VEPSKQTGTRSAHLTFERVGGWFGRWSEDDLHRCGKEIVAEARRHGCIHIAFEDTVTAGDVASDTPVSAQPESTDKPTLRWVADNTSQSET
jgi:hypothetical protein